MALTAALPRLGDLLIEKRLITQEDLDRALELLGGFFEVADTEIGTAKRVDDVAVVRALLDGAFDHGHAFVQVCALIDP